MFSWSSEEVSLPFYRRDNWGLEQSQTRATTSDSWSSILFTGESFGEFLANKEYLECLLREGVRQFQKDVDRLGGI